MQSVYNGWLVALSIGVAILASYTALDLAGRIAIAVPRRRVIWLAGGALTMGVGIWSMHFIGMLAFALPIPLGYDVSITALSLVIAIAVSFFALSVATQPTLGWKRLVVGGVLMGAGIAGMHYTGMAAMRMTPSIDYQPSLFALSIVIAMVASIAALWIAYSLRDEASRHIFIKRGAAATVMGLAITGMHYTGMVAAQFRPGSICLAASGVDAPWLATAITIFTLAILCLALVLSRFDAAKNILLGSVARLDGQLLRLAALDPLTDLPNRKSLSEFIERAIESAKRTGNAFALLFMDIDDFKRVNDSLGHSVGDTVLKAFARRLQECVRNSDRVSRLGGDEFVILVENFVSVGGAEEVALKILDRMQEPLVAGELRMQVTPSVGIALYPSDGTSAETLLRNADTAMYSAKHAGRNTFRFFEQRMNEEATRALTIQRALHDALTEGHFFLAFQPKFYGAGGGLAGAEALIRLEHPELGTLGPLDFIPVAERSGQIVQIGYWVVQEACRQMRGWLAAGLPPVAIAVNLSPRQLFEAELADKILDIVVAANIPPQYLMFEITETAAMADAEKTAQTIANFHAHGFEIAIDDFGTGYSSLAYLQQFRVKQLKIDRFFVNGLDENGAEGLAIVSAIIALAQSLKMHVVAEGVETQTQLDALRSLMCDQLQGFLLGVPLRSQEFARLLGERTASAGRA
ncbi:MAG: EAL domain-containing protein [Candidatus Aquilonibacter sp.]